MARFSITRRMAEASALGNMPKIRNQIHIHESKKI